MLSAPALDVAPARPSWPQAVEQVVRPGSAGLLGGLAAGGLVGGVGGRIAMRVVALQSPDTLQGLTTDDGAATGEITLLGTLGLVVFLALAGGIIGLLYALVRGALPERGRPALWAVAVGLPVAATIIHADGVDYAVLGQRWVSAAMFGAVALGYGALAAALTERFLAPGGLARRARVRWLGVSFVALLPGLVIVPLGLAGAAVAAARRSGLAARVPRAVPVVAVRVVLVAVAVLASLDVVRTLGELA